MAGRGKPLNAVEATRVSRIVKAKPKDASSQVAVFRAKAQAGAESVRQSQ